MCEYKLPWHGCGACQLGRIWAFFHCVGSWGWGWVIRFRGLYLLRQVSLCTSGCPEIYLPLLPESCLKACTITAWTYFIFYYMYVCVLVCMCACECSWWWRLEGVSDCLKLELWAVISCSHGCWESHWEPLQELYALNHWATSLAHTLIFFFAVLIDKSYSPILMDKNILLIFIS